MSEWISVNDKLPDSSISDCDNCDRDCPGDGRWVTPDGEEIEDVIAWMTIPEPYVSPTKYRWRLDPEGYGHLREAYLVASSPFLMVSEWHNLIDNKNYKNVFTREEYIKLSGIWKFDSDLFVPEDIPDDIPDEKKGEILWK